MLLGILREDTLPLSLPPSELSSSQQTALEYVLDILSAMGTLSNQYNDDEVDPDHESHFEVR